MNRIICMLLLAVLNITASGQDLKIKWKFKTGDRVLAPPAVEDGTVYVGSEDGKFYAINANTGSEKWHYATRGRIQGQATLHENLVIFESDNNFYALDKNSGTEVWKHEQSWALWAYKIDPWDDKRSKGIVHDDIFYVGSSLGGIIGLDIKTGERVYVMRSQFGQPVRSTPLIKDSRLFYADWGGHVYAYSLDQQKPLWQIKTYEKKLYDSFGGVVSEIVSYDGKLYFGARNHNLQVLGDVAGQVEWTYADSTGGWIIGDPVIKNDVLYIGGSDNRKMFAFNAKKGDLLWTFMAGFNIYTKPIVNDQHVIFTAGNGYKPNDPGALFVLDKENGELVTKLEVPKGTFSSPAIDNNTIYFGVYDGNVYAVEWRPN